jgi:hypothetical protein
MSAGAPSQLNSIPRIPGRAATVRPSVHCSPAIRSGRTAKALRAPVHGPRLRRRARGCTHNFILLAGVLVG